MAKKKAEKNMHATAESLKSVRLDLTTEEHKMLRVISGFEGESMAAFARLAVVERLREEMKKRGVKL